MTRTHVVTGASSGIGAAVARALYLRGDELILVARNDERAHELTTAYDGARVVVADLTQPDHLESRLAAGTLPPRVDSLLHIAGVVDLSPVADLPFDQLREQIDVNLVAPVVLTRAWLPALRAARGLVLFVNSSAGLSASAGWSAYAASKFGLRAVADSLRAEELEHGVRVTTVYPSRTATPMQAKVHEQEVSAYDASRFVRAESVAASILHVLDLPADAAIPELTIRTAP